MAEGSVRLAENCSPLYAVVEFDDGVQLVPTKWIVDDTCYWPNFTNQYRYDKAVASNIDYEESWRNFPVRKIVMYADDYVKGKRKLKEAELYSDVNSDYDSSAKKKIRRQRARKIIDSESEDEIYSKPNQQYKQHTGTSALPKPPAPPAEPNLETTSARPPQRIAVQQDKPENTFARTPDRNYLSPCNTPVRQDKSEFEAYVKKSLMGMKIKMNAFLHTQHDMIQTQQNILQTLGKLQRNQTVTEDDNEEATPNNDFDLNLLPLASMEDLQQFEEKLKNEKYRKYVVKEMRKIGGQDVKAATYRLLPRLMSNEVGAKFSWIGAKKKQVFSNLETCRLLLDVVRLHFPTSTDVDISIPTKNWLRHARDRMSRSTLKDVQEVDQDPSLMEAA
ncbi:uncharacterized protein LOC128982695 [Macrosteles quadrilineatus]|uniref:uncharacterized protein LOC128982695 n=1 Tax=Macrosteles quadrilineatus TaxID=74068 RepID=UPI0023E2DA52|nr:uncharacterized protein LOC128982695 [Macrosteles quadrilineatus]